MHIRRIALALIGLGLILAMAPSTSASLTVDGHYQGFGDSAGFLNILPPGQDGVLNGLEALQAQAGQYPPHVKDQLSMYGDLVYNTPGLTDDQLSQFFKDASFGVKADDVDRVYSPTAGVTVIRDTSFGVPHIFGDTRYATMFAQGYTGAEDRLFLMDALRHVGRGRLSEFLGASPANVALDREQENIAPYTDADFTHQLQDAIANSGPEGQAIYADLLAYVDGVNQYVNEALLDPTKMPAEYPALQQVPMKWTAEDTVAVASLVGGVFGKGGGGELSNYCGLQQLRANLGGDATQARTIFNDLHFANDPEAPATASKTFPYMTNLGPVNPAANPAIDCASLKPVDDGQTSVNDVVAAISQGTGVVNLQAPWGQITLDFNNAMSNAVLVSGKKTQTGHPIAVFGPQTSYYIPQLLVEKDVHGPGIDARGAAFAGTDLYVQLGRGRNYAWSATSAGADNIDTFVLKLCEPGGGTPTTSSMGYERNGACQPIETFQHTQIAKPSAGGVPAGPDVVLSWRIERTADYGPVMARGTLQDGTPIAIATLRSTYNNELGSARGFYRINNASYMTNGYQSFRQAMGTGVDYTFNWFYIDSRDIGYQASCRCPQRAQGIDAYMPVWGTGQFDWQGFIPFAAEPWDLNPAKGYLTSWNNKQAPGWMANDANFFYGPVYRSQMLDLQVQRKFAQGNKLNRSDIVDIMEEAGTVDLRGQADLSYVLRVLGPNAPAGSDPRLQDMRDRLAAWAALDSHRRDHDHDGQYDDPQSPAIMDAWWPLLTQAIFAPSGDPIGALGISFDDTNRINHIGSAFQDGTYGQVQKDLRKILGDPEQGPLSRTYCGGGNLQTCSAALWSSLGQAATALQTEFNSANVADWKRQVADEDIRHSAVGVTKVPAIEWVNRPTFQQVVQINGPQTVAQAIGAGALTASNGKPIGFSFNVRAYVNGGGDGRFSLNDQAGKQKIDVREITSAHSPAGAACGTVPAGAAHTFEFTGGGTFNGASGRTIHVCVQDNADPGKGLDRLHVDCAGCPYGTIAPYTTELLSSGNVKVIAPPPPAGGTSGPPSVVSLDPVMGAPIGQPTTLTVQVYDTNGQPVAEAQVTVNGIGPATLTELTDSLGQAAIPALPLTATLAVASVGGVDSNPVWFGP
jgi:acyl-homoserine lactone acylase PvdQ